MIKKLFLSFSLVLLGISFVSAQWFGLEDEGAAIKAGSTITNTLTVVAPLTINGDTLDISCAISNVVEYTATDTEAGLSFKMCNKTKTYDYAPGLDGSFVSIKNGNGKKYTFTLAPKEDNPYDFPFEIDPTVKHVYYDALVLELGNSDQKGIIFRKYNFNRTDKIHPFLAGVQQELTLANVISAEPTNTESSLNNANVSGINVTKIADGFAKFIASQFKKELTISFFNQITEKINDPDTRDLQVLFKNTHAELNLIADKFTHYQAYLSSLRQTMEYDCHQIPDRLKIILEDPNSQISDALSSKPNFQYILDNVLTFGLELRDSVNLGNALADLDFQKNVGQGVADQNLKGSLETVQLLSKSLRNINSGPDDSYWITSKQMKGLVEDSKLLNLFLGLVAEQSKTDSIFMKSGSLYNILSTDKAKESRLMVESIISSIKDVQEIISSAENRGSDTSKDIIALQYFDAATDLINTSVHLAPLLPPGEGDKLKYFNTIASNVNDMTRSFVTQKYSMGLLHLSKVLTEIDTTSKALQKINGVISNQGLFIAQMAESRTSDDVAAILENFAAPVGSWRDKRTAQWNIALDSYVGPALYKIKDEKSRVAFSTPVGASVTIPFNHVTFFVSIADLGPITSFRLQNDTSEIANLYLKEILSPGAFVSINFGDRYPVTLNAGYQQFPLLTKVGEIENTANVSRKGGFSGSIVVNIPLFTLYNERKD